jgi:hypothetical protein
MEDHQQQEQLQQREQQQSTTPCSSICSHAATSVSIHKPAAFMLALWWQCCYLMLLVQHLGNTSAT